MKVRRGLTRIGGSMVPTSITTCILVPTSKGAFGMAVLINLKKPFGWYFGI